MVPTIRKEVVQSINRYQAEEKTEAKDLARKPQLRRRRRI
jgi:muconolactone delta-isomerase